MIPTRLIIELVAGVALLILAGSWWHGHNKQQQAIGEQICIKQDNSALMIQLAKQAIDIAAYQKQLQEATDAKTKADKILADLRARPATHVLCHTAVPSDSQSMPGVSSQANSGVRPTGNGVPVRESDFDPGPPLDALHHYLDDKLAACQWALDQWPVQSVIKPRGLL